MNNSDILAPTGVWLILFLLLVFAGHASPIPAVLVSLAVTLILFASGIPQGRQV